MGKRVRRRVREVCIVSLAEYVTVEPTDSGWYRVSAVIGSDLYQVMFDHRPTFDYAARTLLERANRCVHCEELHTYCECPNRNP
jgi:hypothetical protein